MRHVASASGKSLLVFQEVVEVLGKLTASASFEVPRGADVALRIAVPAQWLNEGRTIEVELPRNLKCARCSGSGCDACNQAGAITLRGRTELPEVVQVVLPLQKPTATSPRVRPYQGEVQSSLKPEEMQNSDSVESPLSARPVVIRLPECGGLPDSSKGALVRGFLLLEVGIASDPSPNVRMLEDDEPLSSSKIPRAETRPSEKRPTGEGFEPCRGPTADLTDPAGEPPSSRVARVGLSRPAPEEVSIVRANSRAAARASSRAAGRASSRVSAQSDLPVASQPAAVPARVGWRAWTPSIYWGVVAGLILGIFALILL